MKDSSDTMGSGRVERRGVPPEERSPSTEAPKLTWQERAARYDSDGVDTPCDVVDMTTIAEMGNTTVGTVRSWRLRHPDFPQPWAKLRIGPVWLREDAEAWLRGRGRM